MEKNADMYHAIALFGWLLIVLAVIQTLIVPVPILYAAAAPVWIAALLVKKWETGRPDYIPIENLPALYDLEKAAGALWLATFLPFLIWAGWFLVLVTGLSAIVSAPVVSAAGIISAVIILIFSLPLMALTAVTACLMKKLNYGNPAL